MCYYWNFTVQYSNVLHALVYDTLRLVCECAIDQNKIFRRIRSKINAHNSQAAVACKDTMVESVRVFSVPTKLRITALYYRIKSIFTCGTHRPSSSYYRIKSMCRRWLPVVPSLFWTASAKCLSTWFVNTGCCEHKSCLLRMRV